MNYLVSRTEWEEWLKDFESNAKVKGPTALYYDVLMLSPKRDSLYPDDLLSAPETEYFEGGEDEFVTRIWKIISEAGMIGKLRRACQADLKKREYRTVTRIAYGEELLQNFLTAKPSPEWVTLKPREE